MCRLEKARRLGILCLRCRRRTGAKKGNLMSAFTAQEVNLFRQDLHEAVAFREQVSVARAFHRLVRRHERSSSAAVSDSQAISSQGYQRDQGFGAL